MQYIFYQSVSEYQWLLMIGIAFVVIATTFFLLEKE